MKLSTPSLERERDSLLRERDSLERERERDSLERVAEFGSHRRAVKQTPPPPHPLFQRQIELQEAMTIAGGYGNSIGGAKCQHVTSFKVNSREGWAALLCFS